MAHLPVLPGPGGAAPPPIIKYISLYATYLHPIHPGKLCPSGSQPQANSAIRPTAGAGLPALVGSGTKCERVGPRRCRLEARAQLSSDRTLENKHTPLQPHTRGEGPLQPLPGPDTPDHEEGK